MSALILRGIVCEHACSDFFPRCGLSEGNFVTLGKNESKDIECVVDHVRKTFEFVDPDRLVRVE